MSLIAIDLDGTLLNESCEISAENAAAVRRAQQSGVIVAISTGRMHFDVREICRRAAIKTPIVSANGGIVHDEAGNLLYNAAMEREAVLAAVNWLEEQAVYYEVSTDAAIYAPRQGRDRLAAEMERLRDVEPMVKMRSAAEIEARQDSQAGRVVVADYREALPETEDVYKLYAFTYDRAVQSAAVREFGACEQIAVYQGGPYSFDLVAAEASKGEGLSRLAVHLGLELKEAAAIGDSQNDIAMFEAVGCSIAMGNAKPEIKGLCRFVTKTNQEDGVAHAIDKLLAGSWN